MADTVWILVADSNRARFFESDGSARQLVEMEDMAHPASRMHESKLTSDLPGRTFDRFGGAHHSMEDVTSPKHHEADLFAKTLADHLEEARTRGQFSRLVLAADPRFLGMLRDHMSKECLKLADTQIDKNLVKLRADELRDHLPMHL